MNFLPTLLRCACALMLVSRSPVEAQDADQIRRLQELKKLFDSGLVSKEVNEQRQREILGMNSNAGASPVSNAPAPASRRTPSSPSFLVGVWNVEIKNEELSLPFYETNPGAIERQSAPPQIWTIKENGGQMTVQFKDQNPDGSDKLRQLKVKDVSVTKAAVSFTTEEVQQYEDGDFSRVTVSYNLKPTDDGELSGTYFVKHMLVSRNGNNRGTSHGTALMIRMKE